MRERERERCEEGLMFGTGSRIAIRSSTVANWS